MAQHRTAPGEVVNLCLADDAASKTGRTTALVKDTAFEAVRLVLEEGRRIATHSVPGPLTLQCLQGRVTLEMPDGNVDLVPGSWIYLGGGTPHGLHANERSTMLLTIIFAGGDPG